MLNHQVLTEEVAEPHEGDEPLYVAHSDAVIHESAVSNVVVSKRMDCVVVLHSV